jgi:hypothetical protein
VEDEVLHRVVVCRDPPAVAAALRRHRVDQRPEVRRADVLVEPKQHAELVVDRAGGVVVAEHGLACPRVHPTRWRPIGGAAEPLRVRCVPKVLHERADIAAFGTFPDGELVVQEPEPAQQCVGVAAQGGRAAVRRGQFSQVGRRTGVFDVGKDHAPGQTGLTVLHPAEPSGCHEGSASRPGDEGPARRADGRPGSLIRGRPQPRKPRQHGSSGPNLSFSQLALTETPQPHLIVERQSRRGVGRLNCWRTEGSPRFVVPASTSERPRGVGGERRGARR